MKIGQWQIDALIDGECVVPKTMVYPNAAPEDWAPYDPFIEGFASEDVPFSIGAQLLRLNDRIVLVDTGVGPNAVSPFRGGGLRSSLLAVGVTPADVTDVIFTHLHWDHLGWATLDGQAYFPNADYWCDRRDWDFFTSDGYVSPEFESSGSHPEDLPKAKLASVIGQMRFFEGDGEILSGLSSIESAGHTPGSTVLRVESQGESALLIGDLAHSLPELIEGWAFIAHHDPERAAISTRRIRDYLLETGIPFSAAHFPGLRWGRLVGVSGQIRYEFVDGLPLRA